MSGWLLSRWRYRRLSFRTRYRCARWYRESVRSRIEYARALRRNGW